MNNPMTPQKAADREMIGLPELPERCDLRHDQLGYFMKMLPNGEFVRWHRYIEVRSIAEAALKRIQEVESQLESALGTLAEMPRIIFESNQELRDELAALKEGRG